MLTGLFFGSFNPIHNGHLAIARYLLKEGLCQRIRFVVSPRNPWKKEEDLLDEDKRFDIVRSAIGGDSRMEATDFEFSLPRPSYTWQTLQALGKACPGEDFALIIGGDNLKRFHLWKNYREILDHFPVFVYPRPGEEVDSTLYPEVRIVEAPQMSVSSTEIRRRIAAGEDISRLVPRKIAGAVAEAYRAGQPEERVLLHCCCAPCSAAIIEWMLANRVRPTLFYYNPNIYPYEEYEIRKSECSRYARKLGLEIIDGDYSHEKWQQQICGLEHEPERGKRCLRCFCIRLKETARIAHERGFSRFATTLASSRWKNLDQIAEAGRKAASLYPDVEFWEKNWRKGGLSDRRRILLAENGFYNQQYCGCEYSMHRTEYCK